MSTSGLSGTPIGSNAASNGFDDTARPSRSAVVTGAVIVALHAAIIAAIMLDHPQDPIKLAAPHVITATMIAPTPVPVAAPTPPKHVEPPKPVKPTPRVVHRPTPLPPIDKPSPIAAPAPAPTPPAPAAPPKAAAPAPAPTPAPAIDPNVPKNVRHLTCSGTPPDYPAMSRRRGETGTVVIQFIVGTDGAVESATVKKSSGFPRLDDAARAAALASPCTPYMEGGQAVKAITERPYNFSLSDDD